MNLYTSSSTKIPDIKAMQAKMAELQDQMRAQPNILVVTSKTLAALKEVTEVQKKVFFAGAMSPILGLPIEDYPTVEECLDRMSRPRDGERLQLVVTEDIPVECLAHPWMQMQAVQIASKFGFGVE
jgi:hypothetical protein